MSYPYSNVNNDETIASLDSELKKYKLLLAN